MPGYDRTGPSGQGPITGRGLGACGGGIRRGFGRGRGFGFRRMPLTEKDEKEILKTELKEIELEKKEIEKRLKEIK